WVVVGAAFQVVGSNLSQGEAYFFSRPGGGWAGSLHESARLISSDGVNGDAFGTSVSLGVFTAVVGAPAHMVGSNFDQGQVYVYSLSIFGPSGTLPETLRLVSSDGA